MYKLCIYIMLCYVYCIYIMLCYVYYMLCDVYYIMLCYKLCIYVKICKLLNWQSIIKLNLKNETAILKQNILVPSLLI